MEKRYIESFFFLILLVGTLVVVTVMVLPFLNTVILAAILAFLFSTPYGRLVRALGGHRSLAALLMTVLMLVTILVPLSVAGWRIAREAGNLYTTIRGHTGTGEFQEAVHRVELVAQRFAPGFTINPAEVTAQVQRLLGWLVSHIGSVFAGLTRLVLSFFLLLVFFFYLVRDGDDMKHQLMELSPLSSDQEERILHKIGRAITSVVRGSLVMAILQGLMSGLGMAIFGVPNAALWGAVTVLTSFVPTIGTALVIIPAVGFLFFSGHVAPALGLTLWGLTAVGLLDNLLGPKLMAAGVHIHPLVILLAVLGGIGFFGPMGILLGPILIALLYALLDIYMSIIRVPATHHK